jgi:hypothetical protein
MITCATGRGAVPILTNCPVPRPNVGMSTGGQPSRQRLLAARRTLLGVGEEYATPTRPRPRPGQEAPGMRAMGRCCRRAGQLAEDDQADHDSLRNRHDVLRYGNRRDHGASAPRPVSLPARPRRPSPLNSMCSRITGVTGQLPLPWRDATCANVDAPTRFVFWLSGNYGHATGTGRPRRAARASACPPYR